MTNYFSTFDNPYLAMAQGAYPDMPQPFDNVGPYDFSKDVPYGKKTIPGGRYYSDTPSATDHPDWPKNGVVYLQPDVQLKAIPVQDGVTIQKGLLTDQMAGFNAYFLTDTAELNAETRNTYLTIRGSDGSFNILDPSNWNDWLGNNLVFTLGDKQVPPNKNV